MEEIRQVVVRRPPFFTHPVLITHGLSPGWAREVFQSVDLSGNVALFHDAGLPPEMTRPVEKELRDTVGDRLAVCSLQSGESQKCLASLESIYSRLAGLGVRRDGLVIAFGGGTVGDLIGYAAATWHRGVPWAVLPTTLLAQVDSAVGGKVGINLGGLKNQVGAFHQPLAVIADVAWLAHLPVPVFTAGMGEVLKYAVGFNANLWELLDRHAPIHAAQTDLVRMIVQRCVAIKAGYVAFDERDRGSRRLLNLGHTFAHMLEGSGGSVEHGNAVAVGLVAAARLGAKLGACDGMLETRIADLARRLGLPTGVSPGSGDSQAAWEADKKHRTSHRVVVVPTGIGSCRLVDDPPPDMVREVFRSLFSPV